MYEDFYKLTEKPFSVLPDPEYLFLSERHTLAYTMIEYGVEHGDGFTVVTGDVGCGKTTLIRRLLNETLSDITVGLLSNIQDSDRDLLKWVLLAYDQPFESNDRVALFDQFQQFLINEYREGRRTVLIIDEAQCLSRAALEELRMLSNINADKHFLLQLVLVGQPQFKDMLRRPDMEQFVQRMSSDFHIGPLSSDEVAEYIRHRVSVAGRRVTLFEDDAIEAVARASAGIPRRINVLCDTALVYGFAQEADTITANIVNEVVRDKGQYGVLGSSTATVDTRNLSSSLPSPPARDGGAVVPHGSMKSSDLDIARELFPSRKQN